MQAVSSGLQNISSKTPRDAAAAAMVADAVRIIDNYIKVMHSLHAGCALAAPVLPLFSKFCNGQHSCLVYICNECRQALLMIWVHD